MSDRQLITLSCVGAYLIACVAITVWASRRTRSAADFFVAGQHLGPIVAALAMFSSTLSGFGFIGGPGLVYARGTSSFWIIAATPLGFGLAFLLLAKPLRDACERRETLSLGDVVAHHYGSELARALVAIATLGGAVAYLATQLLAMATTLETLIGPHISLEALVIVSALFLVAYCAFGGILAGVYTDVLQGALMLGAAVWVFLCAWQRFPGGLPEAIQLIETDTPGAAGLFGTLGPLGCLSWFVMFSLGSLGQPHVVSKILMLRRRRDLKAALPLTTGAYTVSALLWIGIGLAMRAAVIDGQHPALERADLAAPAFLNAFASPALAGIVFVGLLAAIMSTGDAFLNLGAAALTRDLAIALGGNKQATTSLNRARLATLLLGLIGAVLAIWAHHAAGRLIGLLGAFGWSTFAAALAPTLAIGLRLEKPRVGAVTAAVSVSLIANLGAELAQLRLPGGAHVGSASILAAFVAFIVVQYAPWRASRSAAKHSAA